MADPTQPFDPDGPDEALVPEDEKPTREVLERRKEDVEMEIFDGVRGQDGNPVLPVRLKTGDRFCFSCHKGVSCWNVCCHGADVTLTPADILRLSKRFGLRPAEFLRKYTVPAMWEKSDMPVAKLIMGGGDGKGACVFLAGDEGCSVYADRPATCRYYPLGLASIKMKDAESKEDFHFLVKETHCKGHQEDKLQSVAEYRVEQGIDDYDEINRGWIDILMKMVSWRIIGGPHGREVEPAKKKMFFMVSTDVDAFRRFVFETKFLGTYAIDPAMVEKIKTDDTTLLKLGFDWMKNVLFNEPTVSLRAEVMQQAIARARYEVGAG